MTDIDRAKAIVETWQIEKVHGRKFVLSDTRKFIELMNDRTRAFIHAMELRTVDQAQGLATRAESTEAMIREGTFDEEARILIMIFGVDEADFYTGVMELSVHACTLLTPRAKVIVDGIDRTNA